MRDRSFVVVAACFFLSGVAALIYETAWTREFSFVFGTSELAVATVLAAYMAGLAGGAAVGGRLAHRTQRPIALYGLLELGIGIAALLVPAALFLATRLLAFLFGGQATFGGANSIWISAFYLLTTFVIVMIPTSFMGATLPLLSRHAVRSTAEIGTRIGALYSVNTAGAVAGTLFAAFVLLPSLGIRQTVHVAVAINGLVFLIAIYLVRVARLETGGRAAPVSLVQSKAKHFHFILPLILVSGALSFSYEVLWVRLLSQLLGGSIYAFATMLASFLLGITLGSAAASRLAEDVERSIRGFMVTQIGIAVLSAGAFWLIDYIPALTRLLQLESHLLLDVSIAMTVLLPSAICIGATFPFAVRILARNAADAGPASARVYSWNTIGAILGSIGAAFLLLPELGFRATILLGVSTNLALAGIAALLGGRSRRALATPAVVWLVLLASMPDEPWQILRSSPINRSAPPKAGRIDFYEVGRGATVLLTTHSPARWRMSTNGLPESMISGPADPPTKLKTAVMLGTIGPLLRPGARSMLVVGLGGGVTLEQIPRHIEQIEVIELEEEVLAANRWLGPRRAVDPLADPRVRVHLNDARSALLLSDQRFDVIAAQASHPWTGGAAHLYTGEFFELVHDHLTPQGVFVQWIGQAFVDLPLIESMVATMLEHFEYVHVYSGILFVGSNAPIPAAPDLEALRLRDPDLSLRTGIHTPEDFAQYLLMDNRASRAFAAKGEITTDDRNLLQMRSPRVRRGGEEASKQRHREILEAYAAHDPLPRYVAEGRFDAVELVARLQSEGRNRRAQNVARAVTDPRVRAAIQQLRGDGAADRPALQDYVRRAPDDRRARARLLRSQLRAARMPDADEKLLPGVPLDATELSLVRASRAARDENWSQVAELDTKLAAIGPLHPLHVDAVFLRANWRIASRDPRRLKEAIALVDDAYRSEGGDSLLILRAQIAHVMKAPLVTLASLARIELAPGKPASARMRDRIRSLLQDVEAEGELAEWRDKLLRNKFPAAPRARAQDARG